jgi:hypothetical protein
MSDSVKLKGILFWCQHNKVNEMSGKYQVDITNLSDAAAAALEELGLEVHQKDDKPEYGKYITCKSKNPIKIVDKNDFNLEDVNIGNGSEVKAVIRSYEWTFKNKKGVSPSLSACVVTKLVEFGGGTNIDDEDVL